MLFIDNNFKVMSADKLPAVPFKNTIQRQSIAVRMYNHRRRLLQLDLKRGKPNEPPTQSYKNLLQQNPKRHYFLQSKYTEIQRENRLLFQKISKISHKKKKEQSMDRMKSLNITFRRKQNQSIENQNVRIYNRILQQKPFISFKETDREFMVTRKMSDRLSKREKYKLEEWY